MKYSLLLIGSLFTSLCNAGVWATQGGKIESLHSESTFIIVSISDKAFKLADDCNVRSEVILEDDTKRGDRQMSMLLAAQMANKPVSIYTSGCKVAWGKKYPLVSAVRIKN